MLMACANAAQFRRTHANFALRACPKTGVARLSPLLYRGARTADGWDHGFPDSNAPTQIPKCTKCSFRGALTAASLWNCVSPRCGPGPVRISVPRFSNLSAVIVRCGKAARGHIRIAHQGRQDRSALNRQHPPWFCEHVFTLTSPSDAGVDTDNWCIW